MSTICIRGGMAATASGVAEADVWIEGERILAVTQPGFAGLGAPDREIDASGRYVLPGGIDVHTHLDMPFADFRTTDDFESGTRAAAFGGTTTVVDYVAHAPGESLAEQLAAWHAKAAGKAVVDYGFHMTVADATPSILEEMETVVRGGVTSFKVYLAYPGRLLLDDASMLRVMLRARELGALVCVHAEAGAPLDVLVERARAAGRTEPIHHALTRPEAAEATGTERAIALAELAGAAVYVVHVSCVRALERVREGRRRGLPVFAETCPQYLFLSEELLRGSAADAFAGAAFVCTPPLRPAAHQAALWSGLASHDLDVVATDHCPFDMKRHKERGRGDFSRIPGGLPGVETRMLLLWEAVSRGVLPLERFVEVTATTPARLFGMYPRKGSITAGADADLVVWDPGRPLRLDAASLHMRVDYSPYEGREVPGSPAQVLSRGEVIVDGGRFLGDAGRGRFVHRAARGPTEWA